MTPRNIEQNQQIRDERREQILKAALTTFARKGLAAAKISDIASLAGLSHGLVYHYFKSKDEIFTELIKTALASSTGVFRQAYEMPGTAWTRLQALTRMILDGAFEGDGPYYFYLMVQAFTSDVVPPEVKEMAMGSTGGDEPSMMYYLVHLLIEGQEAGEVSADEPGAMATAYLAMIQGLAMVKMQGSEKAVMPGVEIMLRLFKNPEEGDGR